MSLILEALKKSEAQRRLGEAPNLGTPFAATRRRRSPLPWITLAVVLAVAAAGWWLLRPQHGPDAETAAGAKGPRAKAATKGATANATPANATPRQGEAHAPPITAIAPPAAPAPEQHAAAPVPTAPAVQHSAPPVTGAPTAVAANPVVAAQQPAAELPRSAAPPPPKAIDAQPGAKGDPTRAAAPGSVAATTPAPAAPAAAPTPAATPPATAPAPVPAPPPPQAEPAMPTVDDLAFELRRDLPTLPISMQVYSNDPTRRFIIVDGERKKEGDAIRDVAIREIRSNGVVLEFRGQRFLLPRPGS